MLIFIILSAHHRPGAREEGPLRGRVQPLQAHLPQHPGAEEGQPPGGGGEAVRQRQHGAEHDHEQDGERLVVLVGNSTAQVTYVHCSCSQKMFAGSN